MTGAPALPGDREYALYDRLEARHWWYRARRAVLSILLERIGHPGRLSLLEIGCGTGGNLKHLFQDFGARTGVELDPRAAAYARTKLGAACSIVEADANALSFPAASFDVTAMLDVLYHKNIRDVQAMLTQAMTILKPGGYLLVSDGAFDFLAGAHSRAVGSARRFTRAGLCAAARRAGFEIVQASYWGLSLFFLLFLKRAVLEKIFRSKGAAAEEERFDLVEIPWLDPLLYWAVAAERLILRRASLPLGASVCLLARKPASN